jgi:hypothetical protein
MGAGVCLQLVLCLDVRFLIFYVNSTQSVPGTFPPGQGEPLNALISGQSDAAVLKDQETNGGLRNYFLYASFAVDTHVLELT